MPGLMIGVIAISFILSIVLNKLAESKGWKKKAIEFIDEKPKMRGLPMYIGVVGLIILLGMRWLGVDLMILIPLQVILVTSVVFLFELFREV